MADVIKKSIIRNPDKANPFIKECAESFGSSGGKMAELPKEEKAFGTRGLFFHRDYQEEGGILV